MLSKQSAVTLRNTLPPLWNWKVLYGLGAFSVFKLKPLDAKLLYLSLAIVGGICVTFCMCCHPGETMLNILSLLEGVCCPANVLNVPCSK